MGVGRRLAVLAYALGVAAILFATMGERSAKAQSVWNGAAAPSFHGVFPSDAPYIRYYQYTVSNTDTNYPHAVIGGIPSAFGVVNNSQSFAVWGINNGGTTNCTVLMYDLQTALAYTNYQQTTNSGYFRMSFSFSNLTNSIYTATVTCGLAPYDGHQYSSIFVFSTGAFSPY